MAQLQRRREDGVEEGEALHHKDFLADVVVCLGDER